VTDVSGQGNPAYEVLRLPDVRRIELGWGASVVGELAGQRLGAEAPGEAGRPGEPDGSDAGQDAG
jgi:hypothetical protein